MDEKERYMRRALTLARKGKGRVSPNPMVGAVVVNRGRVVGEGYHHAAGQPHAEILALAKAADKAQGADLYLNLEPCSHWGRTPPCVEAVAQHKIARVFVGSVDPNPLVAGKGIAFLREQDITVEVGILEEECRRLNEVFFKYISSKIPFVTMKAAATLDGKIATAARNSRWVTGEAARRVVHQLRGEHDAIMVGINTVMADDPLLTCRLPRPPRQPLRIVLDSKLKISLSSQLVETAKDVGVLVATGKGADANKIKKLSQAGVEVQMFDEVKSGLHLLPLLTYLGEREITSVLIEGGGEVFATAIAERIIDKIYIFYATKILGGRDSFAMVGGESPLYMSDALGLKEVKINWVGDDLQLTGYPNYFNRD